MDAAREIIAQGVSDVFTAANVESLPSASIASWCETGLHAKSIEAEQSTHARYKRIIERFTEFLGKAKSDRDLSTLHASDIARFRDREAKERGRASPPRTRRNQVMDSRFSNPQFESFEGAFHSWSGFHCAQSIT